MEQPNVAPVATPEDQQQPQSGTDTVVSTPEASAEVQKEQEQSPLAEEAPTPQDKPVETPTEQ